MSISFSRIEDPRGGWQKFRRRELYAIATQEGIPFTHGAPADAIRIQLQTSGVNPLKYYPQDRGPLENGGSITQSRINIPKEKIKPIEVKQETTDVKIEIEEVNVLELKMPKLRSWCTQHGIQWHVTDKKTDLQRKAKEFLDGKQNAS